MTPSEPAAPIEWSDDELSDEEWRAYIAYTLSAELSDPREYDYDEKDYDL